MNGSILVFAIALVTTFTLFEMQIDEAIDFSKSGKRNYASMFIIIVKKLAVTCLWCYFLYLWNKH
jgi:hypothetical protein